ncbi:O-antigen ligase family protein [Cobetia amphilecti]|uniref:O-antigen ligase family protein n=1 Tax=Cobetia amphilecti TaxID=1055104 RepID=UPI0012EC4227|nr:O-antigen ligase family protein [Cobetia amphilecti]
MSLYIIFIIVCLLLCLFFNWVTRRPERGIYTAFFASGILNTVSLGPLREKVGLTELVFLFTWFAMLINSKWRDQRFSFTGYQRLGLIFLAFFVLVEWLSFFINNMNYYGFLTGSIVETLNITYGAMMATTVILLIQSEAQWKNCIIGWLCGSVVVVIVGFWAMTGTAPSWTIDEFTGRISSTFKFENQMASYLIPIMVISLTWCVSRHISAIARVITLLCTIGMGIVLIGTGSRTAFLLIILLAMCMIFLFVYQYNNNALKRGYLAISIISSIFGLIIYIALAISMFDGVYQLGKTPSWQRPVVMIYQNFINDAGIDQTREKQASIVVDKADESIFIGNGPKLYGSKFNVSEIHNTYAAIFIETGVIGLVSLLIIVILPLPLVFKVHVSQEMKLLFIASALGFVLLLFYNLTMYGLRQRTIWLMIGLLLSTSSISRQWKSISHENSVS